MSESTVWTVMSVVYQGLPSSSFPSTLGESSLQYGKVHEYLYGPELPTLLVPTPVGWFTSGVIVVFHQNSLKPIRRITHSVPLLLCS